MINWRKVSTFPQSSDLPSDGQVVVGYWSLDANNPYCILPIGSMEILQFSAADAPGASDAWIMWDGEISDQPDLWAPIEEFNVPGRKV